MSRNQAWLIALLIFAQWSPALHARAADVPDSLIQAELGTDFTPADLPRYHAVHELLERYFAEKSAGTRKVIAGEIDAAGVQRSIVGRLARVRASWTALAPGVYYINTKIGPMDVRYFLGIPPKYDLSESWPLVVKLPSANAFLTQPPPDADAVAKIYIGWMNDELSAHPDAVLVMPLLNLDELYGPGPVGMNLVMQPIFDASNRVNVDPSRVYLIGHSMAAHAVWNLAIHFPTYFAAINPMAGEMHEWWQRVRLGNLLNILSIVWADASDDVVSVDESREIVRYLRNIKYDVDYTETRDLGHRPSPQIVEDDYQKLRSRQRDLYPKQVFIQSNAFDTILNRADWVQIYQPLAPGEQAKVEFSRGSQGMYLYQNSFRVIGEITDAHTIKLMTKNIKLLRLYLNDQMLDLDDPITVTANGVTRFAGKIQQSTDEMLKDQSFLGRGWRYYTAVLDLDLTAAPPGAPDAPSATTKPIHHGTIEYTGPDGEQHTITPGGN